MEIALYITIAILVALLIYFIILYNNFVTLKNNVSRNWSNIDVLLKQRNDELPKLIETCKQYMKFESETLEAVTMARKDVMSAQENQDIPALGGAETKLRLGLGALFARAEDYPELKASQTFTHLQTRISNLEESIADRREFYNSSVNINNIRVESFPDLIIANIFNFSKFDMLKFDDSELKDVDLKSMFNS